MLQGIGDAGVVFKQVGSTYLLMLQLKHEQAPNPGACLRSGIH